MSYICRLFCFIVFACSILIQPHLAQAAEDSYDNASKKIINLPKLPAVTVVASPIDSLTSSEIIDRGIIEKLPSRNGNVTELLKNVPGVQFSESANNSKTGGEIKPPEISISGGRTADNIYIFDGISISSKLDPDFTVVSNRDNIPGHSQRVFLLDHLVEEVSVLRSNIPASYGNFSGGVVEAKSIDPEPVVTGEISFRMTRSEWGKFFIDSENKEEFFNSNSADNQPEFIKYESSATLHLPINNEMGLLFDYSRLWSEIPLNNFDRENNQKRRNENFFLKFVATPDSRTEIRLSATYAPYQGDHYLANTINSDYEIKEGGYALGAALSKIASFGKIDFNISYQETENSRDAPNEWYSWKVTQSKNWGDKASLEGGNGDLEKREKSFTGAIDFSTNELTMGRSTHNFSIGTEVTYLEAIQKRTENFMMFTGYLADDSSLTKYPVIACSPNDAACIDGEQFIYYRYVRPTYSADADIFDIQAYLEDQISIDRLTLRPGVRVSYDDYQDNLNIAPRLAGSYDLFNNTKTILTGGYNRYYGVNLLALELSSQKPLNRKAYRCVDNGSGKCDNKATPKYSPNYDWLEVPNSFVSTGRISDLDTPYSDEWTVGIQQALLGGQLEFLYIDREYKDQIVSVTLDTVKIDDIKYIFGEWRNAGRRSHQEASLSWERSWKNHYLFMSATWHETKSNSSSYTDSFREHQNDEPDDLNIPVVYEGELTDLRDLPLNDYNRPYKASVIYSVNLPYNFSFTNMTNFQSSYETIADTKEDYDADGDPDTKDDIYDVYDKTRHSSAVTFDWLLSWRSPEWSENSVELTLDILNVLNRKVEIGTEEDGYKLGRQFWAGVTYNF